MAASTWKTFMDSPVGPKTIHFWAPLGKWCLVIAGLADLNRPADKISMTQSGSLAATGFIWSYYSTQIIPKNWSLFTVNFFVGCTGLYQLTRKAKYDFGQKSLAESVAASLPPSLSPASPPSSSSSSSSSSSQ